MWPQKFNKHAEQGVPVGNMNHCSLDILILLLKSHDFSAFKIFSISKEIRYSCPVTFC